MSPPAVTAVAFDVNETLFSLDRLRSAFATAGLDPMSVPLWFARLLRDGFALTCLGAYAPFADVAAQTLRDVAGADVDNVAIAGVLAAMGELDPHPDVEPALRTLADAGVPVVTLTNGSADTVAGLLRRAGLDRYVTRSLSVDAVGRWKPAPEPYRYAADELGVDPAGLALVAVHPWDCAGARAAGLRTGWVRRSPRRWPEIFAVPDVVADDLPSVVQRLGLGEARR